MHHGRRTVWLPARLTQNPAGLCRQWMHSLTVCGSRSDTMIADLEAAVVRAATLGGQGGGAIASNP